jgi:hypothetical protein
MDDSSYLQELIHSRWFRRGWTLQELIAPSRLVFFSKTWGRLWTKHEMSPLISRVAKVPEKVLLYGDVFGYSVAQRMSWAASRETTRLEDLAYCLMGIFDVNMPLLYGEGERAFQRLQEEIFSMTNDQSIFAWTAKTSTFATWRSLLARSPADFEEFGHTIPDPRQTPRESNLTGTVFSLTVDLVDVNDVDVGLHSSEIGWKSGQEMIAFLNCVDSSTDLRLSVGIFVRRISAGNYVRVEPHKIYTGTRPPSVKTRSITTRRRLDYSPWNTIEYSCRVRGLYLDVIGLFKLEGVNPKHQWDPNRGIFSFQEDSILRGVTQVLRGEMVYSVGHLDKVRHCSDITISYNPRKIYNTGYCDVQLLSFPKHCTSRQFSMIRVLHDQAFIVVTIQTSWN